MLSENTHLNLVLENRIALLNKLSNYFVLSSMFFRLNSDLIVTANEQYPDETCFKPDMGSGRKLAEHIRKIIENANLLDDSISDNSEASVKKFELRKKLIRLSQEKE